MRIQIKKAARFVWKLIRYTIAVTLAFIIVGGGLLFWHLQQKPLDLEFLLPQIEKYIFSKDSHLHLTAESIQLSASMNRWGLFHVSATNVSLYGQENILIMELPSVRVSYGLQHVLTFNYMPSNIRVSDALLKLTLTKEGRLILQNQEEETKKELTLSKKDLSSDPQKTTEDKIQSENHSEREVSQAEESKHNSSVSTPFPRETQVSSNMPRTEQSSQDLLPPKTFNTDEKVSQQTQQNEEGPHKLKKQDESPSTVLRTRAVDNQKMQKDESTVLLPDEATRAAIVKKDAIVINDIDQFIRYLLGFRRLALQNASILIEDQKTGRRIEVPELNLSLKRQRLSQYDIHVQTQLLMHQTQPMDFTVNAELNKTARTLTFEIDFDQLNLSRAGRLAEILSGLDVLLQGKIKGELNFSQKEDTLRKAVKHLSFTVRTMQPGTIHLPEPLDITYPVKDITAQGVFSDNLDQLLIRPVKASLTTGLSADVDITIDNIGSFLETGNFNDVKTTLKARMHDIPIEQVPSVWPAYLGPDAHAWVKQNLKEGGATTALFTLYFTGPEITDLLGDIDFKGVTVHYLDPMAPVVNAGGKVMLYPDKVEIFADTGSIGNIQLRVGNIYLTDLLDDISNAKIELDAIGPVPEVLALLDSQPLELVKGFGIQPAKTKGMAEGQVTLHFPLVETLKAEDVQADVTASITNGVFPTPLDETVLQNASLNLAVNNETLSVTGKGTLEGIPVDLKWDEFFAPTKVNQVQSIYTVSGTINEQFLKPYWHEIDSYLKGSFKTQAVIQKNKDKALSVKTNVDLTNAQLILYPLSYTKSSAKPASLTAEVSLTSQQALKTAKFDFKADGNTQITGSYTPQVDSFQLKLDKVQTLDSSFSGSLQMGPRKAVLIQVKGSAWNMTELKETPFIKNSLPDPKAETKMPDTSVVPPDITLDVSLDTLTLTPGMPFKNVSLKGTRRGFNWNNLFLFVQGREATSITYTPSNGKLEGLSGDVGDLLMRLGFSDQFAKGTAVLSGKQLTNGGFSGTLKLKNLNIKEPGFIMQAITILGILDAIRGKDLTFSQGNIPFDLSPSFTLFIKDGVTYGTTLGITFSGRASTEALALTGSVIPAYVLNSLPGRIPVIGMLFKDSQGGGLVGVKYEVTGTPGNPRVRFNPLSTIAPGILGRLFQ